MLARRSALLLRSPLSICALWVDALNAAREGGSGGGFDVGGVPGASLAATEPARGAVRDADTTGRGEPARTGPDGPAPVPARLPYHRRGGHWSRGVWSLSYRSAGCWSKSRGAEGAGAAAVDLGAIPRPPTRFYSSLPSPKPVEDEPCVLPDGSVRYVVEIVTGQVRGAGRPLPAVLQLFGSEGMSDPTYLGTDNTTPGTARGYDADASGWESEEGEGPAGEEGALPPPSPAPARDPPATLDVLAHGIAAVAGRVGMADTTKPDGSVPGDDPGLYPPPSRAMRARHTVIADEDLGELTRVSVQLAPEELAGGGRGGGPASSREDATDGAPAGPGRWFLDRIEIRGPGRRRWTFPCGAWLDGAAAAAAAQERNLAPAILDLATTMDSAGYVAPRRALKASLGAAAQPHPDKVRDGERARVGRDLGRGGEDAYFAVAQGQAPAKKLAALGVFDGVAAWKDRGVDAGRFSRELARLCREEVLRGGTDAMEVLARASKALSSEEIEGSCTACVLLLDCAAGRLHAANLGDSGFALIGYAVPHGDPENSPAPVAQGRSWDDSGLVVRYRSPQQEHEFGMPYQFGHSSTSDRARDALLSTTPLTPGDVIVVGSDGLFDNLADDEMVSIVKEHLEASIASFVRPVSPSALARALVAAAFARSTDKSAVTPYSLAASDAFDLIFNGGKRDDITVLVAIIE